MTQRRPAQSRRDILDDPVGTLPRLGQLLAGYFHEDWSAAGDSWTDVVDEYIAEATREDLLECRAELADVLGAGLSEPELSELLGILGGSVDPAAEGGTPSGWLTGVRAHLDEAA